MCRLLVRIGGKPRLMAFVVALVLTSAVAVVGRPDLPALAGFAVATFAFAALMRLPGESISRFREAVRGGLIGFALSFIWIVGPIAALGLTAYRARARTWNEGAARAIAGTALPAVVLLADLFRDGVPAANYVVVAMLLSGLAVGAGLIAHQRFGAATRG